MYPADLYEKLSKRYVYKTIELARTKLHSLSPNGATVHKRGGILQSLYFHGENLKKIYGENITFKQLKRRDAERLEKILIKIQQAKELGIDT